jgi:hypothetical protein
LSLSTTALKLLHDLAGRQDLDVVFLLDALTLAILGKVRIAGDQSVRSRLALGG